MRAANLGRGYFDYLREQSSQNSPVPNWLLLHEKGDLRGDAEASFFVHGVLLSVQVGELLLLDDLGDRASGASVLASATGDAGVLVSDGSDVLELQNASGAGVDANATSDALVGINYGMSHGSFLSVDRRYRRCASV